MQGLQGYFSSLPLHYGDYLLVQVNALGVLFLQQNGQQLSCKLLTD